MPVTAFGVVLAVLLLVALVRWTVGIPWLLGLCLGVPPVAALVVGGQSIAGSQVVLLVATPLAVWRWLRLREDPLDWPGAGLLAAFVAWSGFITLLGPVLFDGTDVLLPRGGIDAQVADPTPLEFTISNFAQVAYLVLAAVVICMFARFRRLSPHLLAPGLALAAVLSLWRLLHDQAGLPFPTTFFDNSTNVAYVDGTPDGGYRLRGVFPEPSALALYSIATIAYGVAMLARTRHWHRWAYLALVAAALVNLFWSRSGTAVVAGVAVLGLALVVAVVRAVRNGAAVMPVAFLLCVAGGAFLAVADRAVGFVVDVVEDKLGSSSYANRTGADGYSLRLVVDTWGLGLGLGSNRPSSLWPMLLSCVGIVGTVLFAALVLRLVLRTASLGPWRPVMWVTVAAVLTKSIAGSHLTDPLLVLSLALCAHASASAAAGEPPGPPPERAPQERGATSERGEVSSPRAG